MSIRLSPKHGINPSIMCCPICGTDTGVGLLGHLPHDDEAPRYIPDNAPCEQCQSVMDKGVLFVQIRDGETDRVNPYRTGPIIGIKIEAVERMMRPGPTTDDVLKKRVCFMEQSTWHSLGFPESTE